MKNEIISLGGACDVGIVLQWMRIKGLSYPFDWLANFEGLSVVVDVLRNNFETINKRESYEMKRMSPESDFYIVYKNYPKVMHLHSNPLKNRSDHEALVRRMDRFQEVLEDRNLFVNFIYYRNFDALKQSDEEISLDVAFDLLRTEGAAFVDFIRDQQPGKPFSLTLVMQTSLELSRMALNGLSRLATSNRAPEMYSPSQLHLVRNV